MAEYARTVEFLLEYRYGTTTARLAAEAMVDAARRSRDTPCECADWLAGFFRLEAP